MCDAPCSFLWPTAAAAVGSDVCCNSYSLRVPGRLGMSGTAHISRGQDRTACNFALTAVPICRYQKPGGMSWLECYLKISNTQPADLKEAFLYVSGVMHDMVAFMPICKPCERNTGADWQPPSETP